MFFSFILFFASGTYAQAGSVELKDSSGTVVSAHGSIQAAYNAIPGTVTQPYFIEILPAYNGGSETYPITFTARTGVSGENTITMRPAAGNSGAIISATASGTPIIFLNDADFVIIDGRPGGVGSSPNLTIENLATTSSSFTIRLQNGSCSNVIQYCLIKNNTMGIAGPRAIEIGTSVSNPTGNSDNVIRNNKIEGGRSCIGLAGTTANPNIRTVIADNEISDFGYGGIWVLSASPSVQILRNTIYQRFGYSTTSFGIIAGGFTELDIIGNHIFDIQNTGSTSVRGMQITPAATGVLNIINNFVSLTLDNGTKTTVYGIHILGANAHTSNVIYNSINIGGSHSGGTAGNVVSAGIFKANTSASSVYNQLNNIVKNTRAGGPAGVIHTGFNSLATSITGTLNIDYNVYFSADLTSQANWGGVNYSDIILYKTAAAPNEQNTIFKLVNFVTETDLHLTGSSVGDVDLAALPIPGIITDIDGDERDPVLPYRGADEADTPIPVELISFTASIDNNYVTLGWITATEINNSGFEIERASFRKNETTPLQEWNAIGFVKGGGTTTEINRYQYIDNVESLLYAGKISYRLKQIDFDGTYSYSKAVEVEVDMLPKEYALYQNYPNPFNPSTTINYSLPFESNVTINIYNSLGERVSTLVNAVYNAGNHEITFDASNLASGIYFYSFEAGSLAGNETFTRNMKMMLVK